MYNSTSSMLCVLLTLTLIAPACGQAPSPTTSSSGAQVVTTATRTTTDTIHATLSVEGMSCGSCVANVKRTLKGLEGVSVATVSLEKRSATISYDPRKVTTAQIQAAVNAAGYEAGPVKPLPAK